MKVTHRQGNENVEIVRVVLPGREMRKAEKDIPDIYAIARHVVKAMEILQYFESKRNSKTTHDDGSPTLTSELYYPQSSSSFPDLYIVGTSFSGYVGLEVARLLN